MESLIVKTMGLKYQPVAVILTNDLPEEAKRFKEGKWGCVMFLLASAMKGKTAAFDRKTFGCPGGGVGLGFGNQYVNFAGGMDGFCYFLSIGNDQWEQGKQIAEKVKPYLRDHAYDDFLHGERYLKDPDRVRKFVDLLPITDVPFEYVVFKPLSEVDPAADKPEVVIFVTDVDRFAALSILANFEGPDNERVIMPFAAGCQTAVLYPLREAGSDSPRAVAGLMDISARVALKRQTGDDLLSLAVPFPMFQRMESNVPESFLLRNTWKELMELKEK